ncbi:UNVERIFIED_CONTAM: hypothetical protein Sradi_4397400 [Sesamum radiatum]|uniref:Zinc knuckle CX2CX4HX4C domain-containing protein n=1 Tax=Sesamum radiatum TaxID=300843 RepID=A0AAW2NR49_SESRA
MGKEHLVTFTYKSLPNFYYLCGCLWHIAKYCEKQFEVEFQDPSTDTPYGPWLRALILSRMRPRSNMRSTQDRHSGTVSGSRGYWRKAPEIFGSFGIPEQEGVQRKNHISSEESERIAESSVKLLMEI